MIHVIKLGKPGIRSSYIENAHTNVIGDIQTKPQFSHWQADPIIHHFPLWLQGNTLYPLIKQCFTWISPFQVFGFWHGNYFFLGFFFFWREKVLGNSKSNIDCNMLLYHCTHPSHFYSEHLKHLLLNLLKRYSLRIWNYGLFCLPESNLSGNF